MAYTFTLAAAALMSYRERRVFSSSCSEVEASGAGEQQGSSTIWKGCEASIFGEQQPDWFSTLA
jgi:hypothetical protein